MLEKLYPRGRFRVSCLPLLGRHVEDFATWLVAQGYPPLPIRLRLRELPRVDEMLRLRGAVDVADLTAADILSLAPKDSQEDVYLAAVVRSLARCLTKRRRLGNADGPLLIRSCRGLRGRSGAGFGSSMRRLFRSAEVRTADGRCPRVHDIRHTHAVHALLRWYRAGADVQAKLPALAASMGHVSVVSTAYYLALLDPIAQAASERFAVHAGWRGG